MNMPGTQIKEATFNGSFPSISLFHLSQLTVDFRNLLLHLIKILLHPIPASRQHTQLLLKLLFGFTQNIQTSNAFKK
jgi:hypothetical protein